MQGLNILVKQGKVLYLVSLVFIASYSCTDVFARAYPTPPLESCKRRISTLATTDSPNLSSTKGWGPYTAVIRARDHPNGSFRRSVLSVIVHAPHSIELQAWPLHHSGSSQEARYAQTQRKSGVVNQEKMDGRRLTPTRNAHRQRSR